MDISAEKLKQEKQANAEIQEAMHKMLQEVKRKLKGESKNELIRIISALLMDNYALKLHLAEATQANSAVAQEKETK